MTNEETDARDRIAIARDRIAQVSAVVEKAAGEITALKNVLHAAQVLSDAIHVHEPESDEYLAAVANIRDALNNYYRA